MKLRGSTVGSTVLTLVAATSLAGCDGGTSQSFEELATQGTALAAGLPADQTAGIDMPTNGVATYNGIAAFGSNPVANIDDTVEILSTVEVVADFDAPMDQSITGSFSNFRENPANLGENESGRIAGSLEIRSDVFEGDGINGNDFIAVAQGDLQNGLDSQTVVMDMFGSFYGVDASHVAGTMVGDIIDEGNNPSDYFGAFVAEKEATP